MKDFETRIGFQLKTYFGVPEDIADQVHEMGQQLVMARADVKSLQAVVLELQKRLGVEPPAFKPTGPGGCKTEHSIEWKD